MRTWTFVLLLLLPLTGCKAILSLSVNKDWAVDSHPLDGGYGYHPDVRTGAEVRFEKSNFLGVD